MTTTVRHLLFSTFLILFAATCAAVLVYASGFHVDRKEKEIVQTGIMFVNGLPRTASVYINKKLRSQKLPYREIQLTPGSYQVRVAADGYYAWEKNLTVLPRETTFATDITLWRDTKPKRWSKRTGITNLAWYGSALLVEGRTPSGSRVWHITENAEEAWTDSTPFAPITPEVIIRGTYLGANGDVLWYMKDTLDKSIYQQNTSTRTEELYALAPDGVALQPVINDPTLLLWDSKSGALFFAPKNTKTLIRDLGIRSAKKPSAAWSSAQRQFLITTDTEVWFVDQTGAPQLFLRNSQTLRRALFLGDTSSLLIADTATVRIIERDDRDRRNIITLPIPAGVRELSVNKDGTLLAYIDDTGVSVLALR